MEKVTPAVIMKRDILVVRMADVMEVVDCITHLKDAM